MAVSGDWRGDLAPFPSVKNAVARGLELWVGLGDTIYADVPSPDLPQSQATTLSDFRVKHNEVYSSRYGLNALADLRASTSTLITIDDHEVTNDFSGGAAPSSDPRFSSYSGNFINETELYSNGVQAFTEYNPIKSETYGNTGDARTANKTKLYRERAFGGDAAVFALDARSFRDQALPPANPLDQASVAQFLINSFDPTRTMLGRAQIDELKSDLLASQNAGTTWKFVMVPEPMQNLGVVNAGDRFEGYAAERTEILKFIDDNDIQNVVFVAADIHGTLVNNITCQTSPFGAQIDSGAFEITTGAVAYNKPFGPTVAELAFNLGLPGTIPPEVYETLPAAQKEAYVQALVNAQVTPLRYDPLGLDGSSINTRLLKGTWSATNTYGWTEFDIDPVTQKLTVTTYGIPYYSQAQLDADPSLYTSLDPVIMNQFVVTPVPAPAAAGLVLAAGIAASRRRRR
jgi:alkaline phosphatase D